MSNFLDRLKTEYDELSERCNNLEIFIVRQMMLDPSERITSETQFGLLEKQLEFMLGYRETLEKRVIDLATQ